MDLVLYISCTNTGNQVELEMRQLRHRYMRGAPHTRGNTFPSFDDAKTRDVATVSSEDISPPAVPDGVCPPRFLTSQKTK